MKTVTESELQNEVSNNKNEETLFTEDEIEIYEELINTLADDNDDIVFKNFGKRHAIIVLKKIIKNSHDVLNIFTGKLLDIGHFDELIRKIKCGLIVKIIFEETPKENTLELLKTLTKDYNLYLYQLDLDRVKKNGGDDFEPLHFLTGDDRMYRFEEDKKNYGAICSFNRPNQVKELHQHFDFLISNSTPIIP